MIGFSRMPAPAPATAGTPAAVSTGTGASFGEAMAAAQASTSRLPGDPALPAAADSETPGPDSETPDSSPAPTAQPMPQGTLPQLAPISETASFLQREGIGEPVGEPGRDSQLPMHRNLMLIKEYFQPAGAPTAESSALPGAPATAAETPVTADPLPDAPAGEAPAMPSPAVPGVQEQAPDIRLPAFPSRPPRAAPAAIDRIDAPAPQVLQEAAPVPGAAVSTGTEPAPALPETEDRTPAPGTVPLTGLPGTTDRPDKTPATDKTPSSPVSSPGTAAGSLNPAGPVNSQPIPAPVPAAAGAPLPQPGNVPNPATPQSTVDSPPLPDALPAMPSTAPARPVTPAAVQPVQPVPSALSAQPVTAAAVPGTAAESPEAAGTQPARQAAALPVPAAPAGETPAPAAPVPAAAPAVTAPGNSQPVQPAAPAPAPATHPPVQAQLSAPLFSLSRAPSGNHTMTLAVTPEEFGPVTVRAVIGPDGVKMEIFASTDAGREAVRAAMTDLRRDLAGTAMNASLDLSERNTPGQGDGNPRENAFHREQPAPRNPYRGAAPTPAEQASDQDRRMYNQGPALDVLA